MAIVVNDRPMGKPDDEPYSPEELQSLREMEQQKYEETLRAMTDCWDFGTGETE